jgi:hypothetical protein
MQQKQEENIDGSITQRSAEIGLQNTIEVRATALDPKRISTPERKKDFESLFKRIFKNKNTRDTLVPSANGRIGSAL